MTWVVWAGFFVMFIAVLVLDLSVLHRESREMSVRQALGWTVVWILVALSFSGLVYGVLDPVDVVARGFGEVSQEAIEPLRSLFPRQMPFMFADF